ncbi:MAG: gliding motility lipoprotein GldH [Saprospiraceae bacterium]|nr:gliding motility lipoprotein GldH [Saprospiraceae bacterium]MBK7809960.1 gliding motility lipoprotein GldH [Saprospiraceae bacterium]
MNFLLCFLFLLLSLNACQQPFYSKEYKIENSIWTYQQVVPFQWTVTDTTEVYDVRLLIKHLPDLKFQNIYVKAMTEFPDKPISEQLLSLELLNPSGIPNGDCSGNQCESTIVLNEKIQFSALGNFGLKIQQHSRQDSLPGILSLELEIIQSIP